MVVVIAISIILRLLNAKIFSFAIQPTTKRLIWWQFFCSSYFLLFSKKRMDQHQYLIVSIADAWTTPTALRSGNSGTAVLPALQDPRPRWSRRSVPWNVNPSPTNGNVLPWNRYPAATTPISKPPTIRPSSYSDLSAVKKDCCGLWNANRSPKEGHTVMWNSRWTASSSSFRARWPRAPPAAAGQSFFVAAPHSKTSQLELKWRNVATMES